MSDYKKRLGAYGENLAGDFLGRRGYRIIGRNFRTNFGEIDLIALKGDELLFAEVKTRTASDFGYPELAVDRRKIRHLNQTAQIYMHAKNINMPWRVDIISVEIDRGRKTARFRWLKDVGGES